MKIFVSKENPIALALVSVLPEQLVSCDSLEESDAILVADYATLREQYRPDKFFGFIAYRDFETERTKNQPNNIFVMSGERLLDNGPHGAHAFARAFGYWSTAQQKVSARSQEFDVGNITPMNKSYFVLVVDDTITNLELATARLVGQQLILVQGPEAAMQYLNLGGKMPDAVLTDMRMRPDKMYGSLSLDCYGVTETVHNGFAMMFEATKRGIPVAIVTDGNHHQDWTSAMFDHIKETEVNGQKVLFFNNIGKRWDTALKMLLEPGQTVQE